MHRQTGQQRNAVMAVEIAVALTILGLLTTMTAKTLVTYRDAREYFAMRQAAVWAANAQLHRILNGAPIDSQPPSEMVSDRIVLRTRRDPGTGDWTGCDFITVIARIERKRKPPIVESVSMYAVSEVAR